MSEEKLLRSVQRLAGALGRLERQAAAKGGVTVSQLRVLSYLAERFPATVRVSDLADDQGLAVSTMTRNLAVLERKAWVIRLPGSADKRTVHVTLSDAGRAMATRLQDATITNFARAFQAFHPTDRVERAAALDRVAAALDEADSKGPTTGR